MKKINVLLLALLLTMIVTGCSGADKLSVKNSDTPLEPVEKFINVYYFDTGSYEDYKSAFVKEMELQKKDEFDKSRKATESSDLLPNDNDSIDKIMKHMKTENIDENNANIYLVNDPLKDSIDKSRIQWTVTKIEDGSWRIKAAKANIAPGM